MKQILQNLRNGKLSIEQMPDPVVSSGSILIKTVRSLVSIGTERMLVSFGQASMVEKARQQPEKVKQVIDKVRTDGLKPTLDSVLSRLDEPIPLGYSNAGIVLQTGKDIYDIRPGERVVSNGPHAEIVCVQRNLVAKIPDNVSFEDACFTTIGSIALQGLRCLQPTLGETVVVYGLGLIGQIAAQLLMINGCKVIGIDIDTEKVLKAKECKIDAFDISQINPVKLVEEQTAHVGADSVLITASSKSDSIIASSAQMCRKKGRIVLVGAVGLAINRADFYEKELSFQVSCSYGPGRYDESYENRGIDYPLPYVRWTENRNFSLILRYIENQSLDLGRLISRRVRFEDASDVYNGLSESRDIAIVLEYKENESITNNGTLYKRTDSVVEKVYNSNLNNTIGIIGSGLFTKAVIVPSLVKNGATIKYISSKNGISSHSMAKKYGIAVSTTDYRELLNDDEVSTIIVATRHNLHAGLVCESLKAGKHVFVEKPLAMNIDELREIESLYKQHSTSITVGFNRRFSPMVIKLRTILRDFSAISVVFTINAGHIPRSHWTQDPLVGGGRIIGEACHFIDLFAFLAGSSINEVVAMTLGKEDDLLGDTVSILLKTANGSIGSINYYSNGDKKWPKETIDIYACGCVARINNFREMTASGFKKFDGMKLRHQDKGHNEQFRRFVNFIQKGGDPIIAFSSIKNTMEATFAVIDSLKTGSVIRF